MASSSVGWVIDHPLFVNFPQRQADGNELLFTVGHVLWLISVNRRGRERAIPDLTTAPLKSI